MSDSHYRTQSGVRIDFVDDMIAYGDAISPLLSKLNTERGALYTSSFEFPGRYTLWDVGFVNPPLMITSKEREVSFKALNERGEMLLSMIKPSVLSLVDTDLVHESTKHLALSVKPPKTLMLEEERSKQSSVFTVIREIMQFFYAKEEPYLGLYGAFGYDLIFQFESVQKKQTRTDACNEMVLYLPDEIYIVNHRKEIAFIRRYDFLFDTFSTKGKSHVADSIAPQTAASMTKDCDHAPGEYAKTVKKAHEKFVKGDLFEVVPSQTFYQSTTEKPSDIFSRLRTSNPAPYGFLINLGDEEYLIGASPEMYVRVKGKRVETCPISGTIKRGDNAIEDASQIEALLSSEKECAELTMCTDVDRNDKSRICVPGSVKVIGRRQIEMYSRLIHTVDHVEGELREGYDAIDAFLTHMWVVTVTGAPKLWAMSFIEAHEKSPRQWYAGAVGWFGFNGDINTGLTLRTIHLKNQLASVRAGATLLFDSIPKLEEKETRLKAEALMRVLKGESARPEKKRHGLKTGEGKRVLLIDNQDSFVHTLANYFRQTGALVVTTREGLSDSLWDKVAPNLVVISPGPGRPSDFSLNKVVEKAIQRDCPLFGVCLGFQAIVEYFGGRLAILDYPMHGKSSLITPSGEGLFKRVNKPFIGARYHSLYAVSKSLPDELLATAYSEDDILMAVEGRKHRIFGVQFHPEALLSLKDNVGLNLIERVMELA